MTKTPRISMSLGRGPKKEHRWKPLLPPRPPGFQATRGFVRMHDSAKFLGQIEWTSSPLTRLHTYYLSANGHGTHWILWLKAFDDEEDRWKEPVAHAFAPKGDVPESVAAVYLLVDAWTGMARGLGMRRFDRVNEGGLLSKRVLNAIRKVVWPPV